MQRPGLEATISTDIAALTYLVALGERLVPSIRARDLPVVVKEFSSSLSRETDFGRTDATVQLPGGRKTRITPQAW